MVCPPTWNDPWIWSISPDLSTKPFNWTHSQIIHDQSALLARGNDTDITPADTPGYFLGRNTNVWLMAGPQQWFMEHVIMSVDTIQPLFKTVWSTMVGGGHYHKHYSTAMVKPFYVPKRPHYMGDVRRNRVALSAVLGDGFSST